MKPLSEVLRLNRKLRVMGFDDAPFSHRNDHTVHIAGVVCIDTRFDGMVWGRVQRDGTDASDVVCELVARSKFFDQIHAVLFDGIAFGGFNVLDLPSIQRRLDRPVVAVMRQRPDLESIEEALQHLPNTEERLEKIRAAGPIYEFKPFVFQCLGASSNDVQRALAQVTDRGHVPEALRLAHLIGAAVEMGESTKRA